MALTARYLAVRRIPITTAILSSAAGSALAGVLVDRSGGGRWAFVLAAGLAFGGALIAGRPGGALIRANRWRTARLRGASETARTLPALRPPPRAGRAAGPDVSTALMRRPT